VKSGFDELSVRARRGELSDSEQRQLSLLLRGSLEARLAHLAGCQFDAEDSVLPGDHELAARVTRRLLTEVKPKRVVRLRIGWRVAMAGALTVAAAAAGPRLVERFGVRLFSTHENAEATKTTLPAPGPSAGDGRERVQAAGSDGSAAATPLSEPPAAAPFEPVESRRTAASDDRRRVAADDGPAALFAEASRVRRQGQIPRAIACYQDLQRRYPSAAEAHAADIALGMLHSERSPIVALTHFRRYLVQGGPLAPEALWGQAQALSALGRTEEAREAWRTLLGRYPQSAYANAARAKLGADQ
jgi:hypothetical protein